MGRMFKGVVALISFLFLAIGVIGASTPKIVLTAQNFGCPLVDLNGNALVQTQPGPNTIFCLYPNDLLCGYSTDFGGGTTVEGCPAQGYLKCPGCQPSDLVGTSPLVCPVVGPWQALLTFGQSGRDGSITCRYGSAKCVYASDGSLKTTSSDPQCQNTANHIPAAACPTASANRARPSCKPF